ncbi:retrovirus-related pol polyprotein from transposon TNT 1-94 [Tanacetum coccineum]
MAKRAQPVLYDADTLLSNHHPVSIWDSEVVFLLVHQVVSMKKMNEKPGHVRPANGFYDKLNAMMFVPQKDLSGDQVYWLSANEIASQASKPATPATPFVHKSRPPSQVLASLRQVNAVFPQFEGYKRKEQNKTQTMFLNGCYDYAILLLNKQLIFDELEADSLPAKSANARRVEAHHRTLNKKNRVDSNLLVKHSVSVSNLKNVCGGCNKSLVFANHNDCLVMCDDSVNVKPHQTKRFKRQPKKEWKPIKKVWKPISKPVANSKPQWKPTGRHFSLFEKYPLTRIMEPTDMPIELPPSASSSPKITMVSRFIDHKLSDRKAGSKGISGLKHNLFSVGQFCDGGLEVAFRQHSCHIRNYDMVDLLKGSRTTNLYSISLNDMMSASPVCLLTKASSTKSWLWHRRLNHLNFGTLNELAQKNLVRGLPMLKYDKHHQCPSVSCVRARKSKGRTVADSIAERLTRPTAYKFKTDCSIIPVWIIGYVEMLMQGSGRTIQQRKEDLFDEYERFRAIGNESIHDYFVRFHKLVNDMKITQLNIPTPSDENKFCLQPFGLLGPQPTAQSSNDALMATMTRLLYLLSGLPKQFPPLQPAPDSPTQETHCYGCMTSLMRPQCAVAFWAKLVITSATKMQSMRYTPMTITILLIMWFIVESEMHQEEHFDSDAETEFDDNYKSRIISIS